MAGVVLVDCHHATMSSPPPASPPPNPAPAATAAGETSTCPARQRALQLVASTPVETSLGAAGLAETQEVWLAMIEGARESLDIEQFYLANLPGGRLEPVVQAIERAAARGVRVRLIADASFADDYPATLARLGQRIAVRQLDLTGTMGGVQHAKLIIVDGCEIYLGSANFDWRSLEHIHELGLRVVDARLAAALGEVFELDWQLAGGGQPRRNTSRAWDRFPVTVTDDLKVRPAFSPRGWLPDERSWDLPQLVAVIDGAERSLRVQLLTYAAQFRDGAPFPTLDEALRRAARRGVTVRLLVSHWQQRPGRVEDVQALVRDGGVAVKLVTIP